ncbi:MAG: cytochrome c biogenesis protein CcdA [Candidatus Nitrosopolaris sp.]
MTLDIVLIGFAFSAGTVAFLNPCGFAMLPTYVSYFVESEYSSSRLRTTANRNLALISVRRLTRGGLAGLVATAAFIAIFGVTGIAISSLGIGIAKFLPWVAVLSGVIIIGIGVAKAFGKTNHINISSPRGLVYSIHGSHSSNDGKKPGYANFFLFGIGYSIASLSCTLPLFLLIVFQGLSAGGIREGSIVFMTYALGMGSVMIAISLAISASNQTFVKWLRKLAPKMNIITSIVLILDGSYLIYYNLVVGKLLS